MHECAPNMQLYVAMFDQTHALPCIHSAQPKWKWTYG